MSGRHKMQARSSTSGALVTWLSVGKDFGAAGYPGPGSAQDVAVASTPALPRAYTVITGDNGTNSEVTYSVSTVDEVVAPTMVGNCTYLLDSVGAIEGSRFRMCWPGSQLAHAIFPRTDQGNLFPFQASSGVSIGARPGVDGSLIDFVFHGGLWVVDHWPMVPPVVPVATPGAISAGTHTYDIDVTDHVFNPSGNTASASCVWQILQAPSYRRKIRFVNLNNSGPITLKDHFGATLGTLKYGSGLVYAITVYWDDAAMTIIDKSTLP